MLSLNTLVKLAVREAEKSTHRHRVGCVIYNKNVVISTGYNVSLKSRRKLHPKFTRWPNSIHAEVSAILSAREDLSGCSIFVVRINRKGELLLARPCKYCLNYLEYVGIRKIIYSTNGGFEEECL